jgi:hypothetical protein
MSRSKCRSRQNGVSCTSSSRTAISRPSMTVCPSPKEGLGYSAVARSTSSAAAAIARTGGSSEAGLKGCVHAVRSIAAQV